MGVFDHVERKLEGAVSGVFARAFKGDVQPVEITARLQKELDAQAQLLDRERKLVPNDFHITLSPHDYARIVPYSKTLNSELIPQLMAYATQHNYIFNGGVSITYAEDPKLPIGRFNVASKAVADVTPNPDVPFSSRATALAVEVNGMRHPLSQPGLVIGRGIEADLRINDPGISRQHAQILVNGFGPDAALSVEDLGSTNGIMVDGQRVLSAPLSVGSHITIGSTVLVIVSVVSDA